MIDTLGICSQFIEKEQIAEIGPFGNGHINDTFRVILKGEDTDEYILQRINHNVFRDPVRLMENFTGVTEYLSAAIEKRGGDSKRETLTVIKTKSGENVYKTDSGDYYRMLLFVKDSVSYDKVERPEQFYMSAKAFGNFQYLLKDYPAKTLFETIPDFHNTERRYEALLAAVSADSEGRLAEVMAEVEFFKKRADFVSILENARREGRLPLRVTHNDTKLNNILFDKDSGEPICIVDLDTIMPGYSVTDFGDSIRFGATTALEDETDLSLVNFDISLYELYVKGFIEGAAGGLTECELDLLPIGAMMMTLECGMRFLTDYLSGDTYFKISRPKHNLDRARNQMKLFSDMEKALPEMQRIINKYKNI